MKAIQNIKHKMMKKISLLFVLLVSFGCSDDFVEVAPPFTISSETFFQTEEDFENALVGAYDILQSTYINVILGEIASDNTRAGGESPTDVIGWQQVDRMIHTQINQDIRTLWNFNFAGVQRASFIIQNESEADFDGSERLIAEAKFLRAYFNFELVKWFGDLPIKPEGQFELGEELTIPRLPKAQVYEYIINDLLYAVENLETTSPAVGRTNQLVAKALLGKVYLFTEQFPEAADMLTDVVNSGAYHLYGTQGNEDFANLFEFIGENSGESVFEVQYTGVQGAGFGCLQCSEGNVAVGFSGIRGYQGPVFESGFGFNLPTQEAYDAFSLNDVRRDLTILDIEAWASETGAVFTIGNQDDVTGHTGFYNRKYLPRINNNQPDVNLTHPNNYRAIRFADVLLMAAEALNRAGLNDEAAKGYVNQIRERAGLNPTEASGAQLLEVIYNERRLELFGEGHRFFDLVRTGRAVQFIDGFSPNKNEVFPIPLEEIQFSQGNWEQNLGY